MTDLLPQELIFRDETEERELRRMSRNLRNRRKPRGIITKRSQREIPLGSGVDQ